MSEAFIIHLVYAGNWAKQEFSYFEVVDGKATGRQLNFRKKLHNCSVGTILDCKASNDEAGALIIHGKGSVSGWLSGDRKLIMDWEALDETFKLEKRMLAKSELDDTLSELNDIYKHLASNQRKAFLAHCLYEISK